MKNKLWLQYGLIFFVADIVLSLIGFAGIAAGLYFLAFPLIIINPSLASTVLRLDFINQLPIGMVGIFIWPFVWFIVGSILGKMRGGNKSESSIQ